MTLTIRKRPADGPNKAFAGMAFRPIFFAAWISCTVIAGGALTSFHQPFAAPTQTIVSLGSAGAGNWKALHFLSPGCACSQKVMCSLLARSPANNMYEEVILIDGPEDYLAGSARLIEQMQERGYGVKHLRPADVTAEAKLYAVPLLVYADPAGRIAYMGGYGSGGDGEKETFMRSGMARRSRAMPSWGAPLDG